MTDATAATLVTTDDSFLSGKVHLRQPRDGYRVGTDAVMLAATVNTGVVSQEQTSRHAEQRKRLLDMGAGVGGISLAVCQRCANVHITAVEKDQASFDLLSYNISANDQTAVIRPHLGNVLALPSVLRGSFDHVSAQRWLFGQGKLVTVSAITVCRHSANTAPCCCITAK